MNAISAAFGLGSFATPLLTALCEDLSGQPVRVFYIISAMAAASAVPLMFVPSPQKPEDDADSRGDAPSQAEHRTMRCAAAAAGGVAAGTAATAVTHGLTRAAVLLSDSRCLLPAILQMDGHAAYQVHHSWGSGSACRSHVAPCHCSTAPAA